MRHPTEGVLRRLVDEPAGVSDDDRAHVAGCPACLAGVDRARSDAAATGAVLTAPRLDPAAVDAGWRRLSSAPSEISSATGAPRTRRSRSLLRSPLAAAFGVVLVLGGAGAAAAADWLPIFHTETVRAVPVNTGDLTQLNRLPDLSAYGDVQVDGNGAPQQVADAATAHHLTGLDVPRVTDLPRGVTGSPRYEVGNQVSATFTFSAAKAAQAAAATGRALPPVPAGLDGGKVRLAAGPGVAEVWSQGGGIPTLVVARLVAPSADSSGVPFETVRDYLLSLPGIPAGLAAQLRAFPADASTLPLPVPADQVNTSTADVGGTRATVLAAKDGTMSAVVWVDKGTLTGVGGILGTDEVLAVARGLH
ncbi:MAG TPA: hypothetical protein VGN47_12395 [Blastococcus sp.]|jgi:hypothetical protein|nr:hypothetical protein [Blastococcus sp.]